jgi:pimeloyl-ACP methyl ester carboxylesterase
MRDRIALLEGLDFVPCVGSIAAPTLVTTGEPELDRVVPPEHSAAYLRLLPQAEHCTFERTGHIGVVTRPARFATIVADFAARVGAGRARAVTQRAG